MTLKGESVRFKPVKGQPDSNMRVSERPHRNSEVKGTCLVFGENVRLFIISR